MIKKTFYCFLMALLLVNIPSCGVYSFKGASIPDTMKTVTVRFFENNAPLVIPYLSQQFTNALIDRIRNQSRLNIVNTNADATFEGRITDYNIAATAIESNNQTTMNRLTITVSVKYKNSIQPEQSFEKTFTRGKDFSVATSTSETQRQALITDVNQLLTEEIFNAAFANW